MEGKSGPGISEMLQSVEETKEAIPNLQSATGRRWQQA